MGIKDFQKYIKKTYPNVCKSKWNVEYDNLYIDINCVLHHVCYLSHDLDDLLDRCQIYLLNVIKLVKPRKSLYLVADGPAPMAKMILQRKRRFDKSNNINVSDLTLNLTSGTKFMCSLQKKLTGFIEYIKKNMNINVFTSIIDTNEAELKIKYQIQKNQRKKDMINQSHIVFSGDSDMILLLFTLDNLENVYQMIDKNTILNFNILFNKHQKIFGKTESCKYDFVFINLLLGNDYIPKVLYVKLENIWEAYKIVSYENPRGLVSFNGSEIIIDQIFIHDLLYNASKNVRKHLINKFSVLDLKDEIYKNYVDGLFWCFNMYVTGNCSDYGYLYHHHESPHILGIIHALMFNNKYKISKSDPIDVDLYGILLIPEKQKDLLSTEQKHIADKLCEKYPIIYENKKLTPSIIRSISKEFIKIRDELRETINLESDSESDNDSEPVKIYKPKYLGYMPQKKLFS